MSGWIFTDIQTRPLDGGTRDMKLDFKRSLTDYGKVQRAIGTLRRNRALLADTKTSSAMLNMGCGGNTKPNFCNLDYDWRPGVDVVWDVTRGLPFPDRHCGGIFTEHMIEHISFLDARALLRDCLRIMSPGATMRIVVPDGEIYLSEYAKHLRGEPTSIPYAERDRKINDRATPIYSINSIFRDHGHLFIWDAETMGVEMEAAGFVDVQKTSFMQGRDPALLIDSPHRAVESLYMEGSAPG